MVRLLPWKKKNAAPAKPLPRPVLIVGFVIIVLFAIGLLIFAPTAKPLPTVTPIVMPAPVFSGM
jgi:hypothetical protein